MLLKGPQVSWKAVWGYWVWREKVEATNVTRITGCTLTVWSFPASSRVSRQLAWLTASSKGTFSTQLMAAAMDCSVTGTAFSCHFTGRWETLKGITRGVTGAVGNLAVSPQSQRCEQQATYHHQSWMKENTVPGPLKVASTSGKLFKSGLQSTLTFHELYWLGKTMRTGKLNNLKSVHINGHQ